jgi:hypothetical protein
MNVLDIETVILDETILDDHLGCEFRHRTSTCSEDVTHVLIAVCKGHVLVCTNAAELKRQAIVDGRTICDGCGKFASDCWRVVPI